MRPIVFPAAAAIALLAGCGLNGTDRTAADDTGRQTASSDNLADPMASHDGQSPEFAIPDPERRPVMLAQVALDRIGFGPGVIGGEMNEPTRNAISGFQRANNLPDTGELDQPTRQALSRFNQLSATRVVRVPANWGQEPYRPVPDSPVDQAKLQRLGYATLDERLAERFHTTADVLKTLNPGGQPAGAQGAADNAPAGLASGQPSAAPSATGSTGTTPSPGASPTGPQAMFRAGQLVRVPNIGNDRIVPGAIDDQQWQRTLASLGVGTEQQEATRIVVSKSKGTLSAFDANDRLVGLYTVTSGSSHDPLPLGDWGINGISHNPKFSYDPDLFWDAPDSDEDQMLPPGPNGPVGVVWIDLTKEHYGIHGTSAPQTIGQAESHGCVRLTNWDAARVAEMVSTSTKVEFVA